MDTLAAAVAAAAAETKENDPSMKKDKLKDDSAKKEPIDVGEEDTSPSTDVGKFSRNEKTAGKTTEEQNSLPAAATTSTDNHDDTSKEEEEEEEEEMDMNDNVDSVETPVAEVAKQIDVVKAKKTPVKRRKKSKKPPNYPKRPLSAYNIFFKDTREKIITEHGKTNFQEMVRLIASHWREVTDEEKKKYEEMAAKDLVRYKKEVSAYEKEVAEKKRAENERQALLNEKNREKKRVLLEAQRKRSAEGTSGVRLINGRIEEDDNSVLGARFPYGMGREDAMIAAIAGAGGGARDLEMARLRLEQDLRSLEETRALRLRQLELAHMQGGGSGGVGVGAAGSLRGGVGMFGGTGLGDNMELELQRRYLSSGGDHLGISNEHELRQRLAEEQLLRESSFGTSLGLGGRFGAYSTALGMGGQSMGLGNPYEEALLREQMLRRERELLLGGGGLVSSLYGGGLGVAGLGSLGLGGATAGLWGANSAVADADMHTNAAAAGLASLRGQSSYIPGSHLERLSDEELRALSTGRGLDSLSKGTSAFKRVDGEISNKDGMKGAKVESVTSTMT
jgi:hypothetical protein